MQPTTADPQLFPRLSAYLARLPEGLASHPRCQAKGAIVRSMISPDPLAGVPMGALPDEIRGVISAPPTNSAWIPDVHFFGALLAVADVRKYDDAQFGAWLLEANQRVFQSPVYKFVMSFTSPGLLLTMCGTIWRAMHKGTILSAERGERTATALLEFPDRLYDAQVLETIRIAYVAAFAYSRTPEAKLLVEEATATSARFRAEW